MKSWRRNCIVVFGGSILLLVFPRATRAQYSYIPAPPPCPAPPSAVAVKRFARSASIGVLALHLVRTSAEHRYLADAFPDVIARRLASITRIDLFAPFSVRRLSPSSVVDAKRVSREMGVRFLLTGSLTTLPGRPRVDVLLYDTLSPTPVWQETLSLDASGLANAEQSASMSVVVHMLTTPTAQEQALLTRPAATNALALPPFLRGLDAAREPATTYGQRANDYFSEALAVDSAFAGAHAELAASLARMLEAGTREVMANPDSVARLAVRHAERAVALDPTSARWWSIKGLALSFTPSRWNDAHAAFTQATTLDARDPDIGYQRGRAALRMGMRREAELTFLTAAERSPAGAAIFASLGDLALSERRTELACSWLNAAITANPYAPLPYALRAMARRRERDVRLAWSDAEIAVRLGARASGEAAYSLADVSGGDSTRARGLALKLFREFDRRPRMGVIDARLSALALVAVGEHARAISLLERAYPRDGVLGQALADPAFNSLRSDERFRQVVSAVNVILSNHGRFKREAP